MSFGFLHVNLIWWLRFGELPYLFARWSAINPVRKHDSVDWLTNCSNQAWAQSSSWANGIWMCLVECATQNDRGDAYWLYCVWVCMQTPKYTKRAGWANMSKSSHLFGSWAELGLLRGFPAEVRNVWDCLVSKRTCCFRQQLHTNHLLPSIPIVFEKTTHDPRWEPACFLVENPAFLAEWKQTWWDMRRVGEGPSLWPASACYTFNEKNMLLLLVGFWASATCQGHYVGFLHGEQETILCRLAHCWIFQMLWWSFQDWWWYPKDFYVQWIRATRYMWKWHFSFVHWNRNALIEGINAQYRTCTLPARGEERMNIQASLQFVFDSCVRSGSWTVKWNMSLEFPKNFFSLLLACEGYELK